MTKIRGVVVILVLLCAGLVLLLSSFAFAKTSEQKIPSVAELLDKFAETVDKAHTSFITKSKVKVLKDDNFSEKEWAYLSGKSTKHYSVEIRTDGERVKQIQQQWGDMNGSFLPENEKTYASRTYGGEEGYKYSRFHDDPGRLVLKSGAWKDFTVDGLLANKDAVSACFGYLRGDFERFDHILEKAGPRRVTVRDKMEELNGTAHYVIDAKTNRGQYTIWLNPEKGYNFSKATVLRDAGDFYMKGYKIEAGVMKKYSIENIQFTEVDGVWVPVKAKLKLHDTSPTSDINAISDLEITLILIDPDHDALDSFSIDDIRDGAKVKYGDKRPGKYTWRDGKVVDANGREVEYKTKLSSISAKSKKQSPQIKHPSVAELLDRYAQTQDKLKSRIVKTRCRESFDNFFTSYNRQLTGKGQTTTLHQFRTDGERVYKNELSWGDSPLGMRPKEEAVYKSFLWDGKQYFAGKSADGNCLSTDVKIHTGSNARNFGKRFTDIWNDIENGQRIDLYLRRAMQRGDKVSLLEEKEKINDSDCYLIEAAIKDSGKYKLWLDPEHGYNIAKSTFRQTGGLQENGEPYPKGLTIYSSRKVLSFEKIDGIWVPMEAEVEGGRTTRGGEYFKNKYHAERTEFILNPDHDALGSFVPKDVKNGAVVNISGVEGINDHIDFTWKDGKATDSEGRRISLGPNEPGYKPMLLGKPLPQLKQLDTQLDVKPTKDKKILVCFWDYTKSPSRNIVQKLNKRAKLLTKKGVYTILIYTGDDYDALDWLKKQKVSFASGQIKDDDFKVRYNWGVESLPWLILTNKQHIVIAEGFTINQLNEKIKQNQ